MDGDRFDSWIASINREAGTRRRLVQRLALGTTGFSLLHLKDAQVDAKKKKRKKKKKRCKKTFATCSGSNKCCSKRCCLDFEASGRFCGPKGSTCCPAGGACPSDFPICCDPEIVFACTIPERPVCCPPATGFPDGYNCLPGFECCVVELEPACCPVTGTTFATDSDSAPAPLKSGATSS